MTQTVGSNRIANNAITTDKIADGAVNTNEIANSAVTFDKISSDVLWNYDLDDVSTLTDDRRISFPLRYNTSNVSVRGPNSLTVTVGGITQPTFANTYETTWSSMVYYNKGYTIDENGDIKFSDPVPAGMEIMIRVVPSSINTASKIYPFKPIDVLMGY